MKTGRVRLVRTRSKFKAARSLWLTLVSVLLSFVWDMPLTTAQEGVPDAKRAPPAKPRRYFYFNRDYGSESLYGPMSVFLNRGFDVLQLRPGRRNLLSQPYRRDGRVVLRNLGNPLPAIRDDGWGHFLQTEILPLSFTPDTAYWVPNYGLHLFGGGVTFRALSEWYEDHHVPVPWLFSGTTLLLSALANETLENRGNPGFNTDAIADVYVFDLGGMLLFSSDRVASFFSHDIIMADWSSMPTFTFPAGNLNNTGNDFAVKVPLGSRFSPFLHLGLGTLGGVSYQVKGEYSISVAAGGRSYRLTNVSLDSLQNEVKFAPSAALFIDRNQSLLASLQLSNIGESLIQVNVYPNAFYRSKPGVGFWYNVGKHGEFATGVSLTHTLELGVGYERPQASRR